MSLATQRRRSLCLQARYRLDVVESIVCAFILLAVITFFWSLGVQLLDKVRGTVRVIETVSLSTPLINGVREKFAEEGALSMRSAALLSSVYRHDELAIEALPPQKLPLLAMLHVRHQPRGKPEGFEQLELALVHGPVMFAGESATTWFDCSVVQTTAHSCGLATFESRWRP